MTRRKKYFVKQKLFGLAIILLSIVATLLVNEVGMICLVLIPAGIGSIFTKQMVLVNDYFFEVEEKENGLEF